MEAKTAQLRVKPGRITQYGTGGTIFWETPTRARLLIDSGGFELVNAGPSEQPVAGPTETKPAGPLEKKSSTAVPAGPLTASAPSSEPGKAVKSSVSAEALRSTTRKPAPLKSRGKAAKKST